MQHRPSPLLALALLSLLPNIAQAQTAAPGWTLTPYFDQPRIAGFMVDDDDTLYYADGGTSAFVVPAGTSTPVFLTDGSDLDGLDLVGDGSVMVAAPLKRVAADGTVLWQTSACSAIGNSQDLVVGGGRAFVAGLGPFLCSIALDGSDPVIIAHGLGGNASGLGYGPDGRLYVTFLNNALTNGSIVAMDVDGSNPEILIPGVVHIGSVAFDSDDNLYYMDRLTQSLLRRSPAGDTELLASGFGFTGSVRISPDGRIFASDTSTIFELVADEPDSDGDGVPDSDDICPGSAPESPAVALRGGFYMDLDGDGTFEVGRSFLPVGPLGITLEDTGGCNCGQIADQMGLSSTLTSNGCAEGLLDRWVWGVQNGLYPR